MNHTPGPWATHGEATFAGHKVVDQNKRSVAAFPSNGTRPADERNANARLIAAAPDLLAANIQLVEVVKQLLEQIEKVKCGEWKPISICTSAAKVFAEDARAVIAKATGGAA